jgi:hypothetical protein
MRVLFNWHGGILERRAEAIQLKKESKFIEVTLSLAQSVLNFLVKTWRPEGLDKTSNSGSNKTPPG